MLLADLFGLEPSTWIMIGGAIGGGIGTFGVSVYKAALAVLAWVEKKANQWREDDKAHWKEKTDRDNQFLEKLEKNDDKRILVLDKIGDSIAQTATAQTHLNVKIDSIQTDLHAVKADVTVMKDRYGWTQQPERQSSGQQPRMEIPAGK